MVFLLLLLLCACLLPGMGGAGGPRRRNIEHFFSDIFFSSWEKSGLGKNDTIEDPLNKHAIEDLSCSWATTLKNCLGAVFKLGFKKEFDIFVEFRN